LQIRCVCCGCIFGWSNLINRRHDTTKMKARLDANQLLNLTQSPGARLPPARIRIKKNSTTRLQGIIDCFLQPFLRPACADANRLPMAGPNSSPIKHSDSFRAGYHYRIVRDQAQAFVIILRQRQTVEVFTALGTNQQSGQAGDRNYSGITMTNPRRSLLNRSVSDRTR